MKKIIISALLSCWAVGMTAQNAKGQFSLKPMVGINISTIAGGEIDDPYKAKTGFIGGAELEYGVNDWLGLSLGVMYSQQGAKVETSSTTKQAAELGGDYTIQTTKKGKLKTDYLNLPLMANFYIPTVKGLSVKTGIQLGILTSGKLNVETNSEVIESPNFPDNLMISDYPNTPKEYISMTKFCKSVDFGIPVGLSYEYKNIVLDARYYFSLTNCEDSNKIPKEFYSQMPFSLKDIKNRYFSITLGYRFRL